MMSQTEAHRLAASIHALRPDWPPASLSTWIRNNLADRAYRDAAVALAWVATEPETKTPGRVLEDGPWWRAATANKGTTSAITHMCPEHPTERAWKCPPCETAADRADHASGAAAVRAAMLPRPKPAPRRAPKPHDLADARARADQEQP